MKNKIKLLLENILKESAEEQPEKAKIKLAPLWQDREERRIKEFEKIFEPEVIEGHLIVDSKPIQNLGNVRCVEGDLALHKLPNLKELPQGLDVDRIIEIYQCPNLMTLPENLNCRKLNLRSTSIKEIPASCKALIISIDDLTITIPEELKKRTLYYSIPLKNLEEYMALPEIEYTKYRLKRKGKGFITDMSTKKLSQATRNNLDTLASKYGIVWDKVYCFVIEQFDFRTLKLVDSLVVEGKLPSGKELIYIKYEGKTNGSGQSSLKDINGNTCKVSEAKEYNISWLK